MIAKINCLSLGFWEGVVARVFLENCVGQRPKVSLDQAIFHRSDLPARIRGIHVCKHGKCEHTGSHFHVHGLIDRGCLVNVRKQAEADDGSKPI